MQQDSGGTAEAVSSTLLVPEDEGPSLAAFTAVVFLAGLIMGAVISALVCRWLRRRSEGVTEVPVQAVSTASEVVGPQQAVPTVLLGEDCPTCGCRAGSMRDPDMDRHFRGDSDEITRVFGTMRGEVVHLFGSCPGNSNWLMTKSYRVCRYCSEADIKRKRE